VIEKSQVQTIDWDSLPPLNVNAAGLDIGATEIYVCVPTGRDPQPVRRFGAFTTDLHSLAAWLTTCHIGTVAMEATGVYWIPVYEILEAAGFEVYLVNARHIKNVAARKSDVSDCQWIQRLHTYGLLRASFRPAEEIAALRALVRHRDNLIHYRAAHIQHMQKALQLMNVKLTHVISDITGVTGMTIIRAIVAGERDPRVLAQYRDPACKKSQVEIAKSLEGHYKAEHVFVLRQALELYDFYDQQIQACDHEIESRYQASQPWDADDQPPTTAPKPTQRKPRKGQAHFDLSSSLYRMVGVDLTRIDGIDALTAQTLISEIGLDMSKWRTVKHFTSWLGLAPNPKKSGGKVLANHTPRAQNRAAQALRIAAQTLARSKSALGGFYRRIRAKHGAAPAVVATAHKLARIVYHMLKYRQDYHDLGTDYYEQQYKERVVRTLKRKAADLGFRLEPVLTPQVS
jgi:transposase